MGSYRPFAPHSSFPPPPPLPPNQTQQQQQQQQRTNQFAAQNYSQMAPPPAPPSSAFPQNYPQVSAQQSFSQRYPSGRAQHPAPPPLPPHQQYPSQPPPPPPPPLPESSYPLPPPPPSQQQSHSVYHPPSQYSQYSVQPLQPPMQPPPPPPPPSSPPPSSSIQPPPPPPPSSPPPPPPKESEAERDKGVSKDRREYGHSNHGVIGKQQHKAQLPPLPKKVNGPPGRVETEEERRLRKKKEFEKQRQEEKHRQQMKQSSSHKGHGSMVGSRMGDRRAPPLLGGERFENRLKKPTTFLCKLKFRNELPDPTAQPKLMALKRDPDRFTRYTITSLEKMYKPQLHVEPDLGIPLDLLDLSVYNRSKGEKPQLAPEDEELLRDDDETVTPVKKDGIRRKERPTDKGVSWLVKTQYISPLSMESAKQSLTEKQAKELRERKGGRDLLENLNDRERQIKEIEASFAMSKLPPAHATNKNLKPVEIMPLLPHFSRYNDRFVTVSFDGAPTADSETYSKFDVSTRDAFESQAIMKACVASGSDPAKPEKFLGYMVPSPDELSKDMSDERDYKWIREYNWDVRGDDANDPSQFLVSFDDGEARYLPLPTKINLKRKRAQEGRSGEEVEHFPAPSSITVRQKPTAASSGAGSSSRGNASNSRMERLADVSHSSGAEDDQSE